MLDADLTTVGGYEVCCHRQDKSPFLSLPPSEQSLPLQLLPGPQRGAGQAAAPAGAAPAGLAETGAAEGQIALGTPAGAPPAMQHSPSQSYQNAV